MADGGWVSDVGRGRGLGLDDHMVITWLHHLAEFNRGLGGNSAGHLTAACVELGRVFSREGEAGERSCIHASIMIRVNRGKYTNSSMPSGEQSEDGRVSRSAEADCRQGLFCFGVHSDRLYIIVGHSRLILTDYSSRLVSTWFALGLIVDMLACVDGAVEMVQTICPPLSR
jgi:hypothetical protein